VSQLNKILGTYGGNDKDMCLPRFPYLFPYGVYQSPKLLAPQKKSEFFWLFPVSIPLSVSASDTVRTLYVVSDSPFRLSPWFIILFGSYGNVPAALSLPNKD
jgi:hypothetical protein